MTMDSQREYWEDRYDRQGATYVSKGGTVASALNQLSDLVPILTPLLPSQGKLLDFGCGPLRFQSMLMGEDREYVGLDFIEGLSTVSWSRDFLPEDTFDVVVAIFVLQHIVDVYEYRHWVNQIVQSLKPGGRFIVVDHLVMEESDPHMHPRGRYSIVNLHPKTWRMVDSCDDYDGHWVGVFHK